MKTYTQEEIDKALIDIENMSHYEMCKIWRFTPISEESIYFRSDLETGIAFKKRLFEHFGGFSPIISKSLGWK